MIIPFLSWGWCSGYSRRPSSRYHSTQYVLLTTCGGVLEAFFSSFHFFFLIVAWTGLSKRSFPLIAARSRRRIIPPQRKTKRDTAKASPLSSGIEPALRGGVQTGFAPAATTVPKGCLYLYAGLRWNSFFHVCYVKKAYIHCCIQLHSVYTCIQYVVYIYLAVCEDLPSSCLLHK